MIPAAGLSIRRSANLAIRVDEITSAHKVGVAAMPDESTTTTNIACRVPAWQDDEQDGTYVRVQHRER